MSYSFAREIRRSKYRLLGLVGQGQFGRVYCASHRKTGRLVALKELNRDRFSTHKFLRELRFLLSLQHDNIVTCHAMEQTATGRYLIMEYCEGGTLRSLLEEDIRVHPLQGLNLIGQILAGLGHAHQRGIVHCDIKPENILLTVNAYGWTAKISDFGIARLSQEMATDEFSNTGSPAYMAPERFYGQYSTASDLYAVGVMLFELLVGQRPFSGAPTDLMSAHLNRTVQIPAEVPLALQTVIRTALQKLPARRFRSAQAMLDALQSAIAAAASGLSQDWSPSILLRSSQASPPTDFRAEYQELLDTPIQQMMVGGMAPAVSPQGSAGWLEEQFLRVYGNRVGAQVYVAPPLDGCSAPPLLRQPPPTMERVRMPHEITQLVVQPHGCFVVTQEAVYWLNVELFNANAEGVAAPYSLTVPSHPELVAEFDHRTMVVIAPTGDWMATAPVVADVTSSSLHLWNLRHRQPFKPTMTLQTSAGFQLLVADSRHVALCSHLTDPNSHSSITGVQIDFFSRRGTEAGCLKLPIPIRHLRATPTPYRFLAIEPNYPRSVLFLDVKPLRIQRIGLDIAPYLIAATTWGYALMSQEGQIILLDMYGQLIGQIDGPVQPTALMFLAPHQLLIATWEGTQGYLYGANLRDLDLDMLF